MIDKVKEKAVCHIHPWKPYLTHPAITRIRDIPQNDWDLLDKYFPDITSRPSGGYIYSRFLLGTAKPLSNILKTKGWIFFCKNTNSGIYEWTVQSASAIHDAGWLLYSIQGMEPRILVPAIQAMFPSDLHIGLKWKPVKESGKIPWNKRTQAYHVQCDKKYVNAVQDQLRVILSTNSFTHSAGTSLRFIPDASGARNFEAATKLHRLRGRQNSFTSRGFMHYKEVGCIISINYQAMTEDDSWYPSLRELIMRIPSQRTGKNISTLSLSFEMMMKWFNIISLQITPQNIFL